MEQVAIDLGFVFSRVGCPCVGRPKIYTVNHDGRYYELTLYETRGIWRLKMDGYTVATGKEALLKTKIKELWE